MQPLGVNSFSGGITDYPLLGATNRAAKMDNFLITQDNKLTERDGYRKPFAFTSQPFGYNEIDAILPIENDTKLIAMSEGVAKTKDSGLINDWKIVAGTVPSGGQISLSEYADRIYLTSDSDPTPRKVYQNENGDYVARKVGVPQVLGANAMTDASLLASCIALANDIREKLIDHMEDYHFGSYTSQGSSSYYGKGATKVHANRDKKSLSYFQTESFTGLDPETAQSDVPVATVATDATTLFALVKALKLAMNHHVGDASVGTTQQHPSALADSGYAKSPLYHNYSRNIGSTPYLGENFYAGPSIFLQTDYDITSVVDAARELDEIYRVYYIHKYGVHIHSFENDSALLALYDLVVPQIGDVHSKTDFFGVKTVDTEKPPVVTPNYTHLYNFINNIKFIYRKHIITPVEVLDGANWTLHTQNSNNYGDSFFSTAFNVDIANSNSLLTAEILLYHLRIQFWYHNQDSRPFVDNYNNKIGAIYGSTASDGKFRYWTGTADFTSGSANISNVNDLSSAAKRLSVGAWIYAGLTTNTAVAPTSPYGSSQLGVVQYTARVQTSGSGAATLDRAITGSTTAGVRIMASFSKYHGYSLEDQTTTESTESDVSSASSIIADPVNIADSALEIMSLGEELFNALQSHVRDKNIHIEGQNGVSLMNPESNGNLRLANSVYLDNVPAFPFFIPEYGTVDYAFFYSDGYVVDEFQETNHLTVGNPVFVGPVEVIKRYAIGEKVATKNESFYPDAINRYSTPESISAIPTLSEYDTDIKVNIYRTSLNGTVYFEVDNVANGTSTYSDYSLDSTDSQGKGALINRQQIYTTGGVVGFDQVEGAKYLHVVNNKAYYAGIYEDGKLIENRLLQSINGAPDAVPASFFDDFDDEIVGLSSARSNLIVFCKNSIYREAGEFGETGQGFLTHEKISDVVGCLNHSSIVQTEIGIFFAGTDGFYYTDGYQVIKVSLELDETYKSFTSSVSQKAAIRGAYDPSGRRVWWSVRENDGDTRNGKFFVLHLNDGTKPSSTFTTVFGENIKNSAHTFWLGHHWIGVRDGYVMHSAPYQKSDVDPETGYSSAIQFNYLSTALDAGGIFNTKYATKMHVIGDNVGNANIEPYIVRDKNFDNIGVRAMAEISYADNIVWGNPVCVWGQNETWWNNTGRMDEWRRFPRTTIRSDVFQVGFRNSDSTVYASEDEAYFPDDVYADVSSSSNVSLNSLSQGALTWPSDLKGLYISFDSDDYETEYEISSQSGSTLVISTSFTTDTATRLAFKITGYKKNQKFSISSYVVHFANIGEGGASYVRGKNNAE